MIFGSAKLREESENDVHARSRAEDASAVESGSWNHFLLLPTADPVADPLVLAKNHRTYR